MALLAAPLSKIAVETQITKNQKHYKAQQTNVTFKRKDSNLGLWIGGRAVYHQTMTGLT